MTEKILFATPAYGNMVTAAYCRSALVAMEELTKAGIANDWIIPENNDSLVHRARMKIAKTFLDRKEFSHLFWIDADIEYGPADIAALWNLTAEIVPHFDDDVKDIPALFMTPIHNGGLESEDYHFCRIAREAGFKIIMDPKVRLKHWGSYAFGQ